MRYFFASITIPIVFSLCALPAHADDITSGCGITTGRGALPAGSPVRGDCLGLPDFGTNVGDFIAPTVFCGFDYEYADGGRRADVCCSTPIECVNLDANPDPPQCGFLFSANFCDGGMGGIIIPSPFYTCPFTGTYYDGHERKTLPVCCDQEIGCQAQPAYDTFNDTDLCNQIGNQTDAMYIECISCLGNDGFWTALGCISVGDASTLTSNLILVGISIAGGLALLLILYGAFTISTSTGNPEKVKQGQEIITAAITGLIFIILSILLLNFIGVEILKIPGL